VKHFYKNPRVITKKQMTALSVTMGDLGDLSGITHCLDTDQVLTGNQRMEVIPGAMSGVTQPTITERFDPPLPDGTTLLGYYEYKGLRFNYRAVKGWDDDKREQAVVVANRAGGAWDFDILANEFQFEKLIDYGFEERELVGFARDEPKDAEPQFDRAAELLEKWQVKTGDLWQIGDHRLLCGDSTQRADVEKLKIESASMMVTDVPYGVDYKPEWRDEADKKGILGNKYAIRSKGKVENDKINDWELSYKLFLGDVCYVWSGDRFIFIVLKNIIDCGFEIVNIHVWEKPSFALSQGDYHSQHESCIYAVRKGKSHSWGGDRTQSTLWKIAGMNPMGRSSDKEDERTGHATQKPVECMAKPIRNHTFDIIYDPFCGSGTTMVACQNLARRCRAIEISPAYCAVTLERMATAFPDLKIELLPSR
jgi:DNA modification methylase